MRWGLAAASAYETIGAPGLGGIGPLDLAQLDKIDSVDRATLDTTAALLQVVRRHGRSAGQKVGRPDLGRPSAYQSRRMNPMDGAEGSWHRVFSQSRFASMRRVADESVRAGVVLYAIDTRGDFSLNARRLDRLKPANPRPGRNTATDRAKWHRSMGMTQARRDEYSDNQWGGIFLTAQTGGFMITESNRIDAALERVMADQRGYYLLGFQPPADSMEPDSTGTPDYHRLKIEVLRPGLKVRSHAGFFGIGDEVPTAACRT